MKTFKRLTAGLLSTVMLAAMFTACSTSESNKRSSDIPDEFDEDSEWYNITTIDISKNFDNGLYDWVNYRYAGMHGSDFVVYIDGYLKVPEGAEYTPDMHTSEVDVFSPDGDIKTSVDLNKAIASGSDDFYIDSFKLNEDDLTVYFFAYTEEESTRQAVDIDLDSGTASAAYDAELSMHETGDEYYERTFDMGSISIDTYFKWYNDDTSSYILVIRDASGEEKTVDLHEVLPNSSIYDIPNTYAIDDDTILIQTSQGGSASGAAGSTFLELNADTLEVTVADDDKYGWLSELSMWNAATIAGAGTYFIPYDGKGICKLDFDDQEAETVVDFNCCNVNRYDIMNLTVVGVDDEGIILVGNKADKEGFAIFKFVRADKNPNAGKTVLKAASLTGLSYTICEAICRYNDQSDKYYIAIDDRYNTFDGGGMSGEYAISGAENDDYTSANLQSEAEIGDQLAVDIMAGDGPDILFNGASLSQLNNSNYLMDLTSLVSDDSKFFTNITDALKVDGKVYQLPLAFQTVGITTTAQYVADGKVGFTFDEYIDFVDRVCNGKDPITMTQLDYFSLCYAAMSNLFYDGRSVNFNNDDFTALAEFVKNYVKDPVYDDSAFPDDAMYYGADTSDDAPNASFSYIYNISDFLWTSGEDFSNIRILGLPSSDGRGPSFNIALSVAVSAQSKNTDACIDFVNTLLTDEFQQLTASEQYSNPLSRDTFMATAEEDIAAYNENVDWYLEAFTPEELATYGLPTTHIDNSVIDYYEGILNSSCSPNLIDASISLIMREEIQPYFVGQRDLNTVVDTMTNRVTTYINERG